MKLFLLPCLLLLLFTLPHLEQGDFRRDTGRYAAVGLYMWSGGSLAAPYLNPETPYFNKPPLALWIHGLCLKLFGVHLAVARLPCILAALGVVWLSILTALQIGSRAEALVSGIILASTYEFFRRTREISLDLWQLLFLMLTVYLVVSGIKQRQSWLLVAAGVPLGLALLCKPLVGFGLVPILSLWLALFGQSRLLPWLLAGTLPVAVLVALPWHWYMFSVFGQDFISQYFVHEVMDRAAGRITTAPPLYYPRILLQTYWPWMLPLILAVFWRLWPAKRALRPPSRDLVLLGGSWSLYFLLLISLFPDKKPNYALPLYPMVSWISAAGLCRLPWLRLRIWYHAGFPWLGPVTAIALAICCLAPIRFQQGPDKDWTGLLAWLRNQPQISRISYTGLEYNDVCYFYLKQGYWPAKYEPDKPVSAAQNAPVLVLAPSQHFAPLPPQAKVFQNNRFAAFRLPLHPPE